MVDETLKDDQDISDDPDIEEEDTLDSDKKDKENQDDDEAKDKKSAIAQKKYWREKAKTAEAKASKVEKLETELAELRNAVKKPEDDKEAAAQKYIREQAKSVYQELLKEREKQDAEEQKEFRDTINDLLEDNPDVSEEELLETIEEYEVTPKVALKILQRSAEKTTKKPKMPQQRKAGGDEPQKAPDDSKKSMWDIAKEEINRVTGK